MRVFVYWNSVKRCFSVRATKGVMRGRVVDHAAFLCLRDVEFRVNRRGRQRLLLSGVKNVHAGLLGERVDPFAAAPEVVRVTYNPFLDEQFVAEGKPVVRADAVVCRVVERNALVVGFGLA